jgi:hypothetical protein
VFFIGVCQRRYCNPFATWCEKDVKSGNPRCDAIIVAVFDFSCTLLATFGTKNKPRKKWEEKIMKIVTRAFLCTLLLAVVSLQSVPLPVPTSLPPAQASQAV